jgi:CheY-like chemotaxis protein
MSVPSEFGRRDAARSGDVENGSMPAAAGCLEGMCVLVVDDERDARELLAAILSAEGAEVRLAASGTQAQLLLEAAPPDLMVCDLAMPGYDGFDLIRDLRGHPNEVIRRLPAIALSGMPRPEDRQRALDCGFDQHLSKPVDADALVAAAAARRPGRRPAGGDFDCARRTSRR